MRRWLIGIAAALSFGLLTASAAAAAPLPVIYNGAYGYAHASPSASPPGANDWSCKPTTAHPYPVILVHGTFGDMSDSWQALSPLLYDNGYCVFALNYGSYKGSGSFGVYGTGPIEDSAGQLASFVTQVLNATGASKVDIVGHSQGGMMPRYYIKFDGGDGKVDALVGLAPSNHGTTLNGLFTLANYFPGASAFTADCPACQEQEAGSPFMTNLNATPDPTDIKYTVIESRNDEVVTPYTSAFLPQATNITLQDQCALDQGEHLSMPYDHVADGDVLQALDATAPAAGVRSGGAGRRGLIWGLAARGVHGAGLARHPCRAGPATARTSPGANFAGKPATSWSYERRNVARFTPICYPGDVYAPQAVAAVANRPAAAARRSSQAGRSSGRRTRRGSPGGSDSK